MVGEGERVSSLGSRAWDARRRGGDSRREGRQRRLNFDRFLEIEGRPPDSSVEPRKPSSRIEAKERGELVYATYRGSERDCQRRQPLREQNTPLAPNASS